MEVEKSLEATPAAGCGIGDWPLALFNSGCVLSVGISDWARLRDSADTDLSYGSGCLVEPEGLNDNADAALL